jgi:hypothetical protein
MKIILHKYPVFSLFVFMISYYTFSKNEIKTPGKEKMTEDVYEFFL